MTIKKGKHVYIFDYFLDGYFLKWEQVRDENYPVPGEVRIVSLESGVEVSTKVLGTEEISENEHRIFLCSLD